MSSRLPVLSLFTLKDQFIAFAGSVHVVIMNLKKKEQHVDNSDKIKQNFPKNVPYRSWKVTVTP